MKHISKILSRLALTSCLMAAMCGCVKDGNDYTPENDGQLVRVQIKVSGSPATRAAAFSDTLIETIDVLSFRADGSKTYQYRATPVSIDPASDYFDIILNKSRDEHQILVVLANLRNEVNAFTLTEGVTTLDDLQRGLTFDFRHKSEIDGAAVPDAEAFGKERLIPMWGQSEPVAIVHDKMKLGTIYMLRSLAELNVLTALPAEHKPFKLVDVAVYNTPNKGCAIPDPQKIDNTPNSDGTPYIRAVSATVPTSATGYSTGKAYYTSTDGISVDETIYIGEKDNTSQGIAEGDQTWLVISGKYDGDNDPTWYRVPLKGRIDQNNPFALMDVLRNHSYLLKITSVTGRGGSEENPEIANMNAEVVAWETWANMQLEIDGNYWLWIEGRQFDYTWREATDGKFTIETNYPDDWTLETSSSKTGIVPLDDNWITFPDGVTGKGNKEIKFHVAENDAATARTGYIHFKTGRMSVVIEVIQGEANYTLAVTPQTITVGNTAGDHEIKVETTYDYGWTAVVVGENSTWLTIDPTTNSGTKDQQQLKFKVEANPNRQPRSAEIHVTAGRHTKVVTVTQNEAYYMEIDKDAFNFAWNDISDKSFTATTNYPGTWKIYVSSSETATTPVSDFINPLWTGTDLSGNQTIKFWNEYHVSSGQRKAYIHILYGDEKKVIPITQNDGFSLSNCTLAYPEYTYVGAFWKHNQTGERLIRIAHQSGMDGGWIAYVPDETTWVKLDNEKTSDGGVTYAPGESPKDMNDYDSQYQVSGNNKSSRTGKLTSGNHIEFRAGLTGTLASAETAPRYGRIILLYNNCTKYQVIYVRQGEAADYLMRKTDTGGNGESWGSPYPRPDAVKWSPYNLTAANFKGGSTTPYPVGVRGGQFTDYPTQAGAFFQWSDNSPTTAYPPIGSISLNESAPNDHWSSLSATHETCPSPYRRPNDGTTTDFTSGDIAGSEMRQSIYLYPQTYNTAMIDGNYIWGYYADGFFDRYEITSSLHDSRPRPNSTVAASSMKVAYIGSLFYNPNNSASLFMPAAGYRSPFMTENGFTGHYWSSSRMYDNTPMDMWLRSDEIRQYLGSRRYYTVPIRCVRD